MVHTQISLHKRNITFSWLYQLFLTFNYITNLKSIIWHQIHKTKNLIWIHGYLNIFQYKYLFVSYLHHFDTLIFVSFWYEYIRIFVPIEQSPAKTKSCTTRCGKFSAIGKNEDFFTSSESPYMRFLVLVIQVWFIRLQKGCLLI